MLSLPMLRLFQRTNQNIVPMQRRQYIADMMQIEPLVARFDALKTLEEPKDIDKRLTRTGPFREATDRDILEARHTSGDRALSAGDDAGGGSENTPDYLFECDALNRTSGARSAVYEPLAEAIENWRSDFYQLTHDIHTRILDLKAYFNAERETQIINLREAEALSVIENKNFLPDHIRRSIQDQEERERCYKKLEIRNDGQPPSGINKWIYIFGIVFINMLEWVLNYYYLHDRLGAPWPAISSVLLFGMIVAIASHLCGKIIKQRPYYISFPEEKFKRRGTLLLFYMVLAAFFVGTVFISIARYQFYSEQVGVPTLGRGVDLGSLPGGAGFDGIASIGNGSASAGLGFIGSMIESMFQGLGSILASVGFLAIANMFIFLIGSFFSYLRHERVPGLRAAARSRDRVAGSVQKLLGHDKDDVERIRRRFREMREDLMARCEYVDQSLAKLEAMRRELPDFSIRYGIARQADRYAADAVHRYREHLRDELQMRSLNGNTIVKFEVHVSSGRAGESSKNAVAAPAPNDTASPSSDRKIVDSETYFRLPVRSAKAEFDAILKQPMR